jgi:hypothetical protein
VHRHPDHLDRLGGAERHRDLTRDGRLNLDPAGAGWHRAARVGPPGRGWYRGPAMPADNQIVIPPSFIALFVPPGRVRPTETRDHIAERHEFCEDLAQMLMEPAQSQLFASGLAQREVLARMQAGLLGEASAVGAAEARWVICRLAELLDWPQIDPPAVDPP